MSSDRRSFLSIVEEPGPIDENGVSCAWCPLLEPNDAVYRIPDPRYSIGTVSALCSYHLAVFKREHEEQWAKLRSHPEIDGLEAAVEDHALVALDDVAEEIELDGDCYYRVGLDEQGSAYFVRDCGAFYRVVETNAAYDVLNAVRTEPVGGLARAFDHVEESAGWRGLESEWADRARDEERGDDQ